MRNPERSAGPLFDFRWARAIFVDRKEKRYESCLPRTVRRGRSTATDRRFRLGRKGSLHAPLIPFVSYAYTHLVRRRKLSSLFSLRYAHFKAKYGGWGWAAEPLLSAPRSGACLSRPVS